MHRFICLLLTLSISASLFYPTYTKAEDHNNSIADSAPSAILMEKNSGMTLFKKEADKKLPPASMTKVMTLLLIMEELKKGSLTLDETVRVSEHAASMGGSQIFLEAGEEMSVDDLLKGVAVASGNDASVALAERISGSEEEFVKLMNNKAKQLGLKNTHFENPTGLPADNHYSTAHDMAVMARELLLHEDITKYTTIYEDYLRKGKDNEFWLVNTNKLIKSYPGMDGLKTGFTEKAKYCLTATAKKGDLHMIAVVMGAEKPKERNEAVTSLLDFGFGQYEGQLLHSKDDVIDDMSNPRGTPHVLPLKPEKDVVVLKRKNEPKAKYTTAVTLNDAVDLPIRKGDHLGWLTVNNGKEEVSKVRLEASEPMEKASLLELWERSFRNLAGFEKF
ncbi:D-alanyl-D-alanine carboxypeptidase family protein [Halobacillus sp. A5]|uniref:D-alanyl-D-alanine carboxypeptidase family protein n=1 Tax=Halobacillus sp. A5 TaxID=2880263 RepID=UPI0020A659C2|nr:D-alanyl-D-alanine carboxypeptidase family protein [Halobacillus sp. A5]MCP3025792.1 D-alanyl-D-alanine carboxypeptidase [Halobacillus sp. A5]